MKTIRMMILVIMGVMVILSLTDGTSEANDVAFNPAIVGDVLYDVTEGQIVPVISMQIISAYEGLIETRVMAIGNTDDLTTFNKVGVGFGVNLLKLTERLGQTWTAKAINPSIGIAPLYDFSKKKAGFGVYVSVVKIQF